MTLQRCMFAKSRRSSKTSTEESTNMDQNQSRTITQIAEAFEGGRLHERKGGKFFFNFYLFFLSVYSKIACRFYAPEHHMRDACG